ncbi:MAG: DNA mismatch repair endonuclease MutL [Clostridia bacterium]|nr:DNA mismatch repair endonuclease MutL [Clostridia bacterium]
MGNIQVLSFEVANLIAAGEVVDRPASAIKEMMENAIDAGAKHVTVEIQNGGVSLMRVTDDGCGMSAEDLPMAIRRHATSKIRSADDLDGIMTLGFRGEALAAISSVSDMRIMSKRREDETGHQLEVRGGTITGVTDFGCRDGTTVIVEHLFANVPARRKFLKRDATESMAVSANVERVALSHPEVAFRFISDGQIKLDTAGDGKLMSAVYAVFGREFASRLIPLDYEFEGIRIDGFIGRSDNVKANRNGQNFFINHRYVKSRTAQAAIEQAFTSYLPPEKYPVCIMNIGLNPGRVDVNVHPAKLEVKFSNEKPVFEAIYYAVRQALEQDTSRPSLGTETMKPAFGPTGSRYSDMTSPVETERPKPVNERQMSMNDPAPSAGTSGPERITAEEYVAMYLNGGHGHQPASGSSAQAPHTQSAPRPAEPRRETGYVLPPPQDEVPPLPDEVPPLPDEMPPLPGKKPPLPDEVPPIPDEIPPLPDEAPPIPDEVPPLPDEVPPLPDDKPAPAADAPDTPPYRIVGEVFHSYVIVEQGERMLLIDKHAAHERIIFENLRENLRKKSVDSQFMMLPVDVMLMSDEVGLIDTYRKELEAIGFSFTCLRNTVRVDALPSGIETSAIPDMFAAFAEQLAHGTGDARITRDILFEKALFQASCKAAIKAGRDYPPEQVAWVVQQLMKLPDITFCPHGRPVAMEMKKRTLDHQFERC